MISNSIQPYTNYVDGQIVQLAGPDNAILSYQFDAQQRALYIRESLLSVGTQHGGTHVSSDLIPTATCNTPGLLSSDDKCKLDSLLGTRVGVLGYQGAGFPDDGGWLQGDIILAAGSDFIHLERLGNIVRFTVDVPSAFTCTQEECFQIFWIQDETDSGSVRLPSCNGVIPGVNSYGELKVHLFPSSTVVNPNNPQATLNQKNNHPSFIFKRHTGTTASQARLDVVLARQNTTGTVGWLFTPGAANKAECRWFVGLDSDGKRMEFSLDGSQTPGLAGALLYNNAIISKKMAIITGYDSNLVNNNNYKARWFSLENNQPMGPEFTVKNLQQWDVTSNTLIHDVALEILSIGQFIDVWSIQCGSSSSASPCYFCKETPVLNANNLWATLGGIQFGDTLEARVEDDPNNNPTLGGVIVNDANVFDFNEWGLTNFDDPMLLYVNDNSVVPASGSANYITNIVNDEETESTPARRYLEVVDDEFNGDNFQRPVHLWHRASLRNALIEVHLARPVGSSNATYPPIDVLMRAPISMMDSKYASVVGAGTFTGGVYNGRNWIKLGGVDWHDVPTRGAVKVLHNAATSFTYGHSVIYDHKIIGPSGGEPYLITSELLNVGDIVEILHEEYTSPVARLKFEFNVNNHDLEMTPAVGVLDMGTVYSDNVTSPSGDSYIGAISNSQSGPTHWQNGAAESSLSGLATSDDNFYVLNGGVIQGVEYFNVLRILVNESRVWMWWNGLLLPKAPNEPYYTIDDVAIYGKFGLRLWPGAKVRRMIVRSRLHAFSELSLGQLSL